MESISGDKYFVETQKRTFDCAQSKSDFEYVGEIYRNGFPPLENENGKLQFADIHRHSYVADVASTHRHK